VRRLALCLALVWAGGVCGAEPALAMGWEPDGGDSTVGKGEPVYFTDPGAPPGAYDGVLLRVLYDGQVVYEGEVNADGRLGPVPAAQVSGAVRVVIGISPLTALYPAPDLVSPESVRLTLRFTGTPSFDWAVLLLIPAALILALAIALRFGLRRPRADGAEPGRPAGEVTA